MDQGMMRSNESMTMVIAKAGNGYKMKKVAILAGWVVDVILDRTSWVYVGT